MMEEKAVKILMVEDDPHLGYLLKENLESKGFQVHLCTDGEQGYQAFNDFQFGLCILDVMMPKKDGFTLARDIRRKDEQIPIIFLTAKSMQADRLQGFELGCDDYVTKPFSAQELLMRIRAILKRSAGAMRPDMPGEFGSIGRYTFDYANRLLMIEDETRKLSTKEAELLKLFAENLNALINRKIILTAVWGNDDYFTSKSMDVYLTRLRKILRKDPQLEIQNVHGTGYRLVHHLS